MPRLLIPGNLQFYTSYICPAPKCIWSSDSMLLLPLIFHFVISTSPFGQVQSPQKIKRYTQERKKEMKPVFDAAAASECGSIARCGSPYLGTPRSALWNALNDVNDALWVLITSTI